MKANFLMLGCVVVLAACKPPPQPNHEDVSPLTTFDKTRLWVLLRASPVGDGRRCADYFRLPNDPRYRARAQACQAWSLDFTDYLHWNGLPTVTTTHLHDLIYWQWYEQMRTQGADCRRRLGNLVGKTTQQQRADHQQARNACDPFDDAIKNHRQTVQDLGIRLRDTKAYSRLEDLSLEPSGIETP